ncbi:MAG: SusD/RagB family nutrient-binding outer membrane lipoprotein [Chitinophagaceae bacterium]|nr:SusD/RagB family nutrient-binding outer membrane lipoprotein [Chitinophagaceae bacterium]
MKSITNNQQKITPAQKTRFAEIVAAGNLMVDNTNNFQLGYIDNANASHPFYNGENQRLTLAVSKLMVDALKNVNDRRLFYFAEPAAYKITGGLLENDFAAYEGAPSELPSNTLDLNRAAGKYSLVNKRYTIPRAGDPMLILTYGEQCFIIAEAMEEGWVTGSAQTYYESGVKAMLDYYRTLPSAITANLHGMAIDQAYINNYFTGEAAYKISGTKTERLQQIWMQRYFIDFFQGNMSGYRNFLRTGYPNFTLDPATSLNTDDPTVFPKRWKYPTDELTKNPVNYKRQLTSNMADLTGLIKFPGGYNNGYNHNFILAIFVNEILKNRIKMEEVLHSSSIF